MIPFCGTMRNLCFSILSKVILDTTSIHHLPRQYYSSVYQVTCQHRQTTRYYTSTKKKLLQPFDDTIFDPTLAAKSVKNKIDRDNYGSDKRSTYVNPDVVPMVSEVLGISLSRAALVVKKYPQFVELTIDNCRERISRLHSKDVSSSQIKSMPWLLLIGSDFEKRIQTAASILDLDSGLAIRFAKFSSSTLTEVKTLWDREKLSVPELAMYKHRLVYIADRLKCSPTNVADMMGRVPRLIFVPFKTLKAVLDSLLGAGVSSDTIIQDPWIFVHNVERMKKRLQKLQEYKLIAFKPWLLRSPNSNFERFVSQALQEHELKGGDPSLMSFLKARLNCSEEEAERILYKVPAIKTATAIKLNEMIEYLVSIGFTLKDILKAPGILAHSKDKVEKRANYLITHKVPPKTFTSLCLTIEQWESRVKKFETRKLKGKKYSF